MLTNMNKLKIVGHIMSTIGVIVLYQVDWRIGIGVVIYDIGQYIVEQEM